jgi:hypothetical protein
VNFKRKKPRRQPARFLDGAHGAIDDMLVRGLDGSRWGGNIGNRKRKRLTREEGRRGEAPG